MSEVGAPNRSAPPPTENPGSATDHATMADLTAGTDCEHLKAHVLTLRVEESRHADWWIIIILTSRGIPLGFPQPVDTRTLMFHGLILCKLLVNDQSKFSSLISTLLKYYHNFE